MTENNSVQKFAIFDYPMTIKEFHLDTFGHVNNATYLQILEEARWEFITTRGYGLMHVQKSGQGPVILDMTLKFLKELKLRHKINIQSQTISYDKKIGKLRQDILSENGELMFHAEMTFGLFDTKERKLILPTREWSQAIGLES